MKAAVYEYSLSRKRIDGIAEGSAMSAPDDVAGFLRGIGLHEEEQERLLTVVLDAKNRIRGYHTVTVGLLNQALGHPREVFRYAVINNAHSVIVAHNHPSGDPEPSGNDLRLTDMLKNAGEVLGIKLVDHIILGDGRHYSFAANGLM